jgi:hypothetical protein
VRRQHRVERLAGRRQLPQEREFVAAHRVAAGSIQSSQVQHGVDDARAASDIVLWHLYNCGGIAKVKAVSSDLIPNLSVR